MAIRKSFGVGGNSDATNCNPTSIKNTCKDQAESKNMTSTSRCKCGNFSVSSETYSSSR